MRWNLGTLKFFGTTFSEMNEKRTPQMRCSFLLYVGEYWVSLWWHSRDFHDTGKSRWCCFNITKTAPLRDAVFIMCWRILSVTDGDTLEISMTKGKSRKISPLIQQKRPAEASLFAVCWRIPIFPERRHSSIFGTTELNFCVRDGNRWTLCVNLTNY